MFYILWFQQQRIKYLQGNSERGKRQDKLLRDNILNKLWLRENTRWGKKDTRKSILKRKITKLLILRAFFPELHEAGDENMPCGFCGLKYCSVHDVRKGWLDLLLGM